MVANVDAETLHTEAPIPPPFPRVWQEYDRWANLPPEFVEVYAKVQPPVRPKAKRYRLDGTYVFEDVFASAAGSA